MITYSLMCITMLYGVINESYSDEATLHVCCRANR